MSESIGVISLDLVIKENITNQLNKIKSNVQNAFSKPIEQASNTVKQSINKTFESADKTISDFKYNTKSELEQMAKEAVKPLGEMKKKYEESLNDVSKEISKPVEKKIVVKTVTAKDALDLQGIADPIEQINEQLSETMTEAGNILGSFEISTDPLERLEQELENTKEKISLTQKKWQELNSALQQTDNDADASKIIGQLNSTEKQLISLQSQADKTANQINSANESESESAKKTTTAFAKIKGTVVDVGRSIKSKINSAVSKSANLVKKTLGGAFKGLKSVAGKALDGIKGKFSKLHGSVGGLEKPVKKLGRSIKNAFRRVFVMAGVLALVKALRSAITGACNDNDEFAKSLNGIKANLAIAFEPIKNTIMPYINALMQGLVKVTQTVAAFTNALFGSTYKKSLNTLKKAQKANKEAVKEAKKSATYLNSYDEMNVAQDTKSDGSSDSKSEDSGIDYSAINGDNVKLPDWAERMKEAIKKGDWKGVGSLLAEKVNSAVDGINWDKVKAKVNGFMKGVADGLNGFIKKINWKKLGKAFGEGINTIFGGLYTFMKTFDWSAFGKSIADFLNNSIKTVDWSLVGRTLASKWTALIDTLYAFVTNFDFSGFGSSIGQSVNAWFDEIDWAKLGETISESIKGLFDTLMGFLETVDWQGIGEMIWTLVKSIDWSGIAEKLFKTIGEAIGAAVSFIWGFIKEAVYKIRDYFKGKMQECGGSVIKGLLKGLWDGIKGIGNWIKDHIFKPFVEGFKKVFKIHSPSKVMSEMGDYITQGLRDGVAAGIGKIKEIFGKILSKIKEVFAGIGKWFKGIFSDAWDNIKGCFSKIGEFFSKVWKKIKQPFEKAGAWFYNIFKGVVKSIKNCFNRIWDVVKRPINWIIDGINTLIGGLNKINFDIPDWVPEIGGKNFGFNIPEIPKLAKGGLATAPTLAMVGDNRNAKADPEVISPLSKLQGMLDNGKLDEVAQLLREILMYLKTIDFTFYGTVDKRVVFELVREMSDEYKRRTGVSAF